MVLEAFHLFEDLLKSPWKSKDADDGDNNTDMYLHMPAGGQCDLCFSEHLNLMTTPAGMWNYYPWRNWGTERLYNMPGGH